MNVANLVKQAVNEQMAELKKCIMEARGKTGNDMTDNNEALNQASNSAQKAIKSPSMGTIYSPAVKQKVRQDTGKALNPNKFVDSVINANLTGVPDADPDVATISDYIERIRLEFSGNGSKDKESKTELDNARDEIEKEARFAADKAILDAEKFKATINTPKSKWDSNILKMQEELFKAARALDDDDEFFHSTCHVDAQMKQKIAKGLFVDLNKIVPKQLLFAHSITEGGLRLVNNNGVVEFKLSESESKITGIRSWDKAFRVYSTIYSQANPHRASEILQYAAVINTAAQKFNWDDVAQYDYVFRHLMERKPERSWAKTYTQMWNMTLCGQTRYPKHSSDNGGRGKRGGQSKENVCWRYNKNRCKFGKECRYDHRCSYCDGSHPLTACGKKKRNGGEEREQPKSKRDRKTEKTAETNVNSEQ